MWLSLAGVKPLPLVTWQLVQLVRPTWFMVAGVQAVPMAWQLPQVVLFIGATRWALAPVVGRPAPGTALFGVLWQPDCAQLVAEVTPSWRKVAPSQLVVPWQDEHSEVVATCTKPPVEITVHALPVLEWQLEQLTAPVWFMRVPGPHTPPMVWQVAQAVLVIGA